MIMKVDHTQVRCPNDYDFKFYVDLIFSVFNSPSVDIPAIFTYIGNGSTSETYKFPLSFHPRMAFLFSKYNFGVIRAVEFNSDEADRGAGLGTDSAHSPLAIGFNCDTALRLSWFVGMAYLSVTPIFNQSNVYYVCMVF